jgi:cytochrome c oxidase subunit II
MFFGLFARHEEAANEERHGQRWILIGGVLMPSVVLAIVFGFTIRSSALTANDVSSSTLTIEVIGRRWWWEVNYPEQAVITANEIHIPVGIPVEMLLRSGDVIHSFWVPQLHGKMDLIPGRDNRLILQADEPGIYRGECAEYCGLQHAKMQFMVIAQDPQDFEQWTIDQSQATSSPTDESIRYGQEVFISAGCVYCHTIRGLDAGDVDRSTTDLGPDLTHLASRTTIAAGILDNNRGNLSGWIADPHGIKPGVLMPATPLSGEELQALLTYLQTLR